MDCLNGLTALQQDFAYLFHGKLVSNYTDTMFSYSFSTKHSKKQCMKFESAFQHSFILNIIYAQTQPPEVFCKRRCF